MDGITVVKSTVDDGQMLLRDNHGGQVTNVNADRAAAALAGVARGIVADGRVAAPVRNALSGNGTTVSLASVALALRSAS
jgi:hypothetical protein